MLDTVQLMALIAEQRTLVLRFGVWAHSHNWQPTNPRPRGH